MNQAVHTVDLMQWLMGDVSEVTSVMEFTITRLRLGI
ncbi:MAG: hypothetical protein ACLR23_28555 [Clostridia bacterium]